MLINFKLSIKSVIIFCLLTILLVTPFFDGGNNDFILALVFFVSGIILIIYPQKTWIDGVIEFIKSKSLLIMPFLAGTAFIFFILITNFTSNTPYFSWFYFAEIIAYFLMLIVVFSLNLRENFFKIFPLIFVGEALILCIIGLYFYQTGFNNIVLFSTFYNPNAFASYLLFFLPFTLYFLMKNEQGKVFFLFTTIIIFSSFILTGSRGAFLSFLPSFILLTALFLKKKGWKNVLKKFILLLVGCFILINIFSYLKQEKNNSSLLTIEDVPISFEQIKSSFSGRFDFWKGAVLMFKEKPIFGWGLSSFSAIYPRYQPSAISFSKYTHNYYLEILGETGVLGSITFYVFILSLIYFGFKNFKLNWTTPAQSSENERRIFINLFFSAILSSIIHAGIDFGWNFRATFLTFFILTGLFLNLYKQLTIGNNQQKIDKKRINYLIKYLLVALGLILILISLVLFYTSYCFKQGKDFESQGNYLSAILAYSKGTKINPNPVFLLKEGVWLFSQGDFKQAEKIAQKLKVFSPENKDVWFLLGKIESKKQNPDAENYFKKAVATSPYFINGYLELSDFYLKKGEIDEASKIIDKAIEKNDEHSIQYFKNQCQSSSPFIKNSELKKLLGCFNYLNEIIDLYLEKSKVENIRGDTNEELLFLKKAEEIKNFLSEQMD